MVQRPDFSDEFLTVDEVAGVLKVNQQTIRNWIAAGRLPAVRVGRRVRIIRRDLDAFLERGQDPQPVRPLVIDWAEFWRGDVSEPDARSDAVGQ